MWCVGVWCDVCVWGVWCVWCVCGVCVCVVCGCVCGVDFGEFIAILLPLSLLHNLLLWGTEHMINL